MIKTCINCGAEFETKDEREIRCEICIAWLEEDSK